MTTPDTSPSKNMRFCQSRGISYLFDFQAYNCKVNLCLGGFRLGSRLNWLDLSGMSPNGNNPY